MFIWLSKFWLEKKRARQAPRGILGPKGGPEISALALGGAPIWHLGARMRPDMARALENTRFGTKFHLHFLKLSSTVAEFASAAG